MKNEAEKREIDATCIACQGKRHAPYAVKDGYKVWKCETCGTLFLFPPPGQTETESIYGKEYFAGAKEGFGYVDYDADKAAMRSVFERYLRDFERILGKAGRLVDIGAATGYFMKIAEERGWVTHGIEISAYAADFGRSRGLDIETGTIHTATFEKESFDLVTMWDILEHVPDPALDIGKACSLLKPGGLLAINTPDSGSRFAKLRGPSWHLLVPPEHIFYFNRKSLKLLLDRNGLEILEVGCIGKRFTLEYLVHMLLRKQKQAVRQTLLHFFERHQSVGRFPISINLRDNMYLLAKKKHGKIPESA